MSTNLPQIGCYQVTDRLKRYGACSVYRVENINHQQLILKMLNTKDPKHLKRFDREISLLCKFKHPKIPRILDTGVHEGHPYFVMEHIEGLSLYDYVVNKQRLKEREAISIVTKVAEVIHQAHQQGIIHRDLTPNNIILIGREPYVIDFGMAYHDTQEHVTQAGSFIGTPCYMPPEQISYDYNKIGPWSDVYAMGACLYFMLAGIPPFYEETQVEMLKKMMHEPPKPLTTVSKNLEKVILKSLAKNIDSRYPSIKAFMRDLSGTKGKSRRKSSVSKQPRSTWLILVLICLASFFVMLLLGYIVMSSTLSRSQTTRPTSQTKTSEEHTEHGNPIQNSTEHGDPLPNPVINGDPLQTPIENGTPQQNGVLSHNEELEVEFEGIRSFYNASGIWEIPKQFGSWGTATWQTQGAIIQGRCSKPFGLLIISDNGNTNNYIVECEVMVEEGELGIFVRGFASYAQFPNFLGRMGLSSYKNKWIKVKAIAYGNNIQIMAVGTQQKLTSQFDNQRPSPARFPQGVFGFGLNCQPNKPAIVNIRNIRFKKLVD